jgi:hypothetical protein
MKIIITESQYEMLFKELPTSLKRRLTSDDFEYFDNKISKQIYNASWRPEFDKFSYDVISQLMHEFVVDIKDDEIATDNDPEYGTIYNDDSLDKVFDMYWELIPFLEKHYKDMIYARWKVKGKSR